MAILYVKVGRNRHPLGDVVKEGLLWMFQGSFNDVLKKFGFGIYYSVAVIAATLEKEGQDFSVLCKMKYVYTILKMTKSLSILLQLLKMFIFHHIFMS